MTAQEKAQAGLWLLKEALVQYLADHPQGVTPSDARAALGLENPGVEVVKETRLFWGLHDQLEAEGRIEVKKIDGHKYLFPMPTKEGRGVS